MRNVMERVEAITKIESLVTRKYQQFLDWLGVPGDRHKPSEVARVVLDFCHDATNVMMCIAKLLALATLGKVLAKLVLTTFCNVY